MHKMQQLEKCSKKFVKYSQASKFRQRDHSCSVHKLLVQSSNKETRLHLNSDIESSHNRTRYYLLTCFANSSVALLCSVLSCVAAWTRTCFSVRQRLTVDVSGWHHLMRFKWLCWFQLVKLGNLALYFNYDSERYVNRDRSAILNTLKSTIGDGSQKPDFEYCEWIFI